MGTEVNVATVRRLVGENQRIIYEDIRGYLGIGRSQIKKILRHLKVSKPSWVWCKKMLLKYNHGCSNAVYDIVTGDETCIYCYIQERKQQSSVWVFEGDIKPIKLRQTRSVGKKL